MYFYLLLFFSKAIFWGEDWDPQKMLGTPIWSDMWVPGPRMKNPSAIPVKNVLTCTQCNVSINSIKLSVNTDMTDVL